MEYLIVGLGNYPDQYSKTRHNIGFMVLDLFEPEKKTVWKYKPQTMMNNSGKGIKRRLKTLNIPIENLIVVYDDASMDFGKIRYRESGSAGGHNGIKSIIHELKTDEFKRIKVGVGLPDGEIIDHVLGNFSDDEFTQLNDGILDEVIRIINEKIKEE